MSDGFHAVKRIAKARRQYVCEQCGTWIEAGAPYERHAGQYDGDFYHFPLHPECAAAALDYAETFNCFGEEWPWFRHDGALDEDESVAWLRERHPVVFDRLDRNGQLSIRFDEYQFFKRDRS